MRTTGLMLLAVALFQDAESVRPWVGISMRIESNVPAVEGTAAKVGIRVAGIPANSPAQAAGVRVDDLIVGVDGKDWEVDAKDLAVTFRNAIAGRKVGDAMTLRIIRDEITGMPETKEALPDYLRKQPPGTKLALEHKRSLLEIKVTLGPRPPEAGTDRKIPEALGFPSRERPEEALLNALVEEKKIGEAYGDLRRRLAKLEETGDVFRLMRSAYAHRDPFQLRTIAEDLLDRLPGDAPALAAACLGAATRKMDPLKTGLSFEEHLAQLVAVVKEANDLRAAAFGALSADDVRFIDANADTIGQSFSDNIYLNEDEDAERYARHARVLELSTQIDFGRLFDAATALWRVRDPRYLTDLEAALRKEWEVKGRPGGDFVTRDTEAGKLIVSGHERVWHRDDAAILLDLDGPDFYAQNAGAGRGACAVLIDFGGDDAYEATVPWAQGTGRLGVGCLIDRAGDDEYVGMRWAQSAVLLGGGLLIDEQGNDTYRGDAFVQGAALWGIGMLIDGAGNDRYEARLMSQGIGMPGGAGWLLDVAGDDQYYAKGSTPTGYGDPGIFDAWSQGCGVGFRQLQSGGLGLVWDGGGSDRYEAGNFSQGGGYYYGLGMLRDCAGDDRYVGSRYAQGFTAHQAVGFFEDLKGNDRYHTRQAVAQGLAWDESLTVFVDREGDDVYEGGGDFAQGASAQNGFCIFLDLGGRDSYRVGTKQGLATVNDYHGGTSLSLFIDAGGEADDYGAEDRNGAIFFHGNHGFACDLPGTVEEAAGEVKALMK